jgi:hypothetical protein
MRLKMNTKKKMKRGKERKGKERKGKENETDKKADSSQMMPSQQRSRHRHAMPD